MAISAKADGQRDYRVGIDTMSGAGVRSVPVINRERTSRWSRHDRPRGFDPGLLNDSLDLLDVTYEEADRLLWCSHGDREHPCYTRALLDDLLGLLGLLRDSCLGMDAADCPIRHLVWRSTTPRIWNLGGDLALFIQLIEARDIDALKQYAHRCVDVVHQNFTKSNLPYLTIALVEGDALGGGFEAVLSNDVVIAEEHCQFGLPEIMFNMFPGMGAFSFLARKLGEAEARSMILSGRLYAAKELYDLGLVDMVVPTGSGEEGLRTYLDRNRHRHRALLSMSRVSRRCSGLDYAELIDVADIWVDNAMGIASRDLRRMKRLVRAQQRRHSGIAGV